MNKQNNIFSKIASAQIDEYHIESERKLMSKTNQFRRNLIRHLCVNEYFEQPTQGLVADWLEHYETRELVRLCRKGRIFSTYKKRSAPVLVDGQCHALAAFNWFLNETLGEKKDDVAIITGISCRAFNHSWLFDRQKQIIIEPTTIDRENYFGYEVEQPMDFFLAELNQIFKLIEEGAISNEMGNHFESEFKKYFDSISYSHVDYLERISK